MQTKNAWVLKRAKIGEKVKNTKIPSFLNHDTHFFEKEK